VIPATEPAFSESSSRIYEKVTGRARRVGSEAGCSCSRGADRGSGVSDADYSGHWLRDPVRGGRLSNGRKKSLAQLSAGRGADLQQGSIQGITANKFADQFANACSECYHKTLDKHLSRARSRIGRAEIRRASWLQRR